MRTADECYSDMCGTAEGKFTDEEMNNVALMAECNDLMFNCSQCGWWCEVGDWCVECAENNGYGETCQDCCTCE